MDNKKKDEEVAIYIFLEIKKGGLILFEWG